MSCRAPRCRVAPAAWKEAQSGAWLGCVRTVRVGSPAAHRSHWAPPGAPMARSAVSSRGTIVSTWSRTVTERSAAARSWTAARSGNARPRTIVVWPMGSAGSARASRSGCRSAPCVAPPRKRADRARDHREASGVATSSNGSSGRTEGRSRYRGAGATAWSSTEPGYRSGISVDGGIDEYVASCEPVSEVVDDDTHARAGRDHPSPTWRHKLVVVDHCERYGHQVRDGGQRPARASEALVRLVVDDAHGPPGGPRPGDECLRARTCTPGRPGHWWAGGAAEKCRAPDHVPGPDRLVRVRANEHAHASRSHAKGVPRSTSRARVRPMTSPRCLWGQAIAGTDGPDIVGPEQVHQLACRGLCIGIVGR